MVRAPYYVSKIDIMGFVAQKQAWLAKQKALVEQELRNFQPLVLEENKNITISLGNKVKDKIKSKFNRDIEKKKEKEKEKKKRKKEKIEEKKKGPGAGSKIAAGGKKIKR